MNWYVTIMAKLLLGFIHGGGNNHVYVSIGCEGDKMYSKCFEEILTIQYLVENVQRIEASRSIGEMYFEEELKDIGYGWHNMKFPIEYREYLLTRTKGRPLSEDYELYYLFMDIKERILEEDLSARFYLRDGDWKNEVKAKTKEWNPEVQQCIIDLISKCTRRQASERIKDPDCLRKTSEWIFLEKNYLALKEAGILSMLT